MHLRKILTFFIALLSLPFIMNAQVTTSSISGSVKSGGSAELPGASITAVHIPTGTVYSALARSGGRFDINNMNPGGPYRISVSFSGFQTETREDVFLILGETL